MVVVHAGLLRVAIALVLRFVGNCVAIGFVERSEE